MDSILEQMRALAAEARAALNEDPGFRAAILETQAERAQALRAQDEAYGR